MSGELSAVSGTPLPVSSRTLPVWALRALIRIEECRIEFYQAEVDRAAEESPAAEMACAQEIKVRWQLCLERLRLRRAHLAAVAGLHRSQASIDRFSPAASSLDHAAPSSSAAQPATPLQNT